MSTALVVLTTVSNVDDATRLARGLIEERLCACVNITPGIRSFYRWEGVIEDEQEVQLVIKTARPRLGALKSWLGEHHPYDVPEFLVLSAEGSEEYLRFIQRETRTQAPPAPHSESPEVESQEG